MTKFVRRFCQLFPVTLIHQTTIHVARIDMWKVLSVRLGKDHDSLWFKLHCFVQPLLVDTPRKVVVLVGGGGCLGYVS